MSEDEIRKEFEMWFALFAPYCPGLYDTKSMFLAYLAGRNAALEAAANDIMENSPLEWPENIGVADGIRALKHTPEQSNE